MFSVPVGAESSDPTLVVEANRAGAAAGAERAAGAGGRFAEC